MKKKEKSIKIVGRRKKSNEKGNEKRETFRAFAHNFFVVFLAPLSLVFIL